MSRPGWRLCAAIAAGAILVAVNAPGADATPGPPTAPEYWFDSWRVTSLWASGALGQGVTIAEIDTGVATLPELDGRVLKGTDFGSSGGNGRTDREVDAFGHGTAMASIMVARPGLLSITGMAPDAKILPIAIPLNGTTDAGESDHLPQAIRYAADHGAKIISMSLGGKRTLSTDTQACSNDEQTAIYHAIAKGAIVTASIGNTGPTRNSIEDPAVCLGVVSVGASDASGHVASFSTRQPYLTLVAPGVGVPSLGRIDGEAYSGDGTSQATALTSAALALVWSKFPHLTGAQVVARVLATLDERRSRPSSAYGYGLLDTYRAITAKVPADAPNPVYQAVEPFLARSLALAKIATAKPPAAAPIPVGNSGGYSVGGTPRLTSPQVLTGAWLGGGGLVLLVGLLIGAVLTRRRIAHVSAPSSYGYPPPSTDHRPQPWPASGPTGPLWPTPATSGPPPVPPRALSPIAGDQSPPPRPRPRPTPTITWQQPPPADSVREPQRAPQTEGPD